MNKKQTMIMWICVIWIVLVWLGAPRECTKYEKSKYDFKTRSYSFEKAITIQALVKPTDVFVNWMVGGIIASALIYTLRTKKPKDEQEK